jgi:hypothetical protein
VKKGGSTINLSSEKLFARYEDTVLKCDTYHFRRSGLDLRDSHIKLDKYFLSFVPYTMSLKTCRLLVSMNDQEIALFESFREQTHSMKLAFDSDIFGQRVEFLLWGKITDIHPANPSLKVALVTFKIQRLANAYREIFVDCVMDDERLQSLYGSEDTGAKTFDGDCFNEIFGYSTVSITPGMSVSRPFSVKSFSLKKMKLFGPVPDELDVDDRFLRITLVDDKSPLFLNGHITGDERSGESSGFRFIDVELDYSPSFTDIMSPFLVGS